MNDAIEPAAGPRTVYAVSELAEILRGLLEDALPSVWVQGEISNLSRPASGHWYFTLKDERAQLRCAMFKNANYYVRPMPKDGDQVLVRGRVSLYPARGDLQLICEHLEPTGVGALLAAFEATKKKLAAEGLFDATRKRPLPALPRRIGVITSGTGAAIHDILTTLARRWPLVEVVLYPVPVQGAAAAPAVARALAELPRLAAVDVVILARGGGSLEDLWAFNEEAVARAIRACAVPVVTGVGHEIDVTIADFAADLRAATPTAAAERVTPDRAEQLVRIEAMIATSCERVRRTLGDRRDRLAALGRRLEAQHPRRRLQQRAQRLDELEQRLLVTFAGSKQRRRQRCDEFARRLAAAAPNLRFARQRLGTSAEALIRQWQRWQQQRQDRLSRATALLDSLSPQAVLGRGYALVRDAAGVVVRDAAALGVGDAVNVRLARGAFDATVDRVSPPSAR